MQELNAEAVMLQNVFTVQEAHSAGNNGSAVKFLNDEATIFRSGKTLVLNFLGSGQRQVLSFEPSMSLDCFAVKPSANENEIRIFVGLHSGTECVIRVYDGFMKELGTLGCGSDYVALSSIALSQCGEYVAAINCMGKPHVSYWELMTGRLLCKVAVSEDNNFVCINPFNKKQLVSGVINGHMKRCDFLLLSSISESALPSVCRLTVDDTVETSRLEQKVSSIAWMSDSNLVVGTKGGEVVVMTIPANAEHKRRRELDIGKLKAQAELETASAHIIFSPAANQRHNPEEGEQMLRDLVVSAEAIHGRSSNDEDDDPDSLEDREFELVVPVRVVCDRVPFAGEQTALQELQQNNALDIETKGQQAEGNPSGPGAVVLSMCVIKGHIVLGTADGSLIWLDQETWQCVYSEKVDQHEDGLVSCAVAPSYGRILTLTGTGRLYMTDLVGDFGNAPVRRNVFTPMVLEMQHDEANEEEEENAGLPKLNLHPFETKEIGFFSFPVSQDAYHPSQKYLGNHAPVLSFNTVMIPAVDGANMESAESHVFAVWTQNTVVLRSYISSEIYSSYTFKSRVLCAAPSPNGVALVVGLQTGATCVLDISERRMMRMVFAERFHRRACIGVAFNEEGSLFATLGPDHIYFVHSATFNCLGFVSHEDVFSVKEEAPDMDELVDQWDADFHAKRDEERKKNKAHADMAIRFFWIGRDYSNMDSVERVVLISKAGKLACLNAPSKYHTASPSFELDESDVNAVVAVLPKGLKASHGAAHGRESDMCVVSCGKRCLVFSVQSNNRLKQVHGLRQHQRNVTGMCFGPVGKLFVTCGSDGMINVYNAESFKHLCAFFRHDIVGGGIRNVSLNCDEHILLSTGRDGGLLSWDVSDSFNRADCDAVTREFQVNSVTDVKLSAMEELGDEPSKASEMFLEKYASAMDYGGLEEEQKPAEILEDLEEFRARFKTLLERNETAQDLERLPISEFAIDLEMREKLVESRARDIEQVRADIVRNYQCKELRAHRIKEQTWNSMEVQSEMFNPFVSGQAVYSFASNKISKAMAARHKKIEFQRRLAIMETKYFDARYEDDQQYHDASFLPSGFTTRAGFVMFQIQQVQQNDETRALGKTDAKDNKQGGKSDSNNPSGVSRIETVRGLREDNTDFFLYHPLEVCTPIRKRIQSYLLAIKIREVKRVFNEKFTQYKAMKEREIEVVHDKANRIEEIQEELHLTDRIYRPVLAPEEQSANLLTVLDSEIKAERVLTKEEREAKEKKEREERERNEGKDDGPQRALDDMMNGTLEVKRDLSLLEQELIKEDWMDEIPENEMTEEQLQEYVAFQKKVKMIQQEQETRRKLLYTELSKHKSDVAEVFRSFDSRLKQLVKERVRFQNVIYQHEQAIIRLLTDIIKEETLEAQEKLVTDEIMRLRHTLSFAETNSMEFREEVAASQRKLETMVSEFKQSERLFKRDFQDAGPHFDQLYRSFKTKVKTQQAKAAAALEKKNNPSKQSKKHTAKLSYTEQLLAAQANSHLGNVDPLNQTSSTLNQSRGGSRRQARTAAEEIPTARRRQEVLDPFWSKRKKEEEDNPMGSLKGAEQLPEGLNPLIFNRFLERCEAHLEHDREIRKFEEGLREKNAHMSFLTSIEVHIRDDIETYEALLDIMKERRYTQNLNTEVQLLLQQGMVEFEEAPVVTELKLCEMIHRNIVEELSAIVREFGTDKVGILREIMSSNTAISLRNWTLKKLDLELKDQTDINTELQLLRVTKSLQSLIKMGGHDSQKAIEIKRLNHKIEFLQQSSLEKVDAKKEAMAKSKRKIRNQQRENDRLLVTVQELEQAVRERLQISQLKRQETKAEKKASDLRMKAIVTRRKLVDLAKLQSEEIQFLRQNVEGLRRRTFASFALPKAPPNPDEWRDIASTKMLTSGQGSRGDLYSRESLNTAQTDSRMPSRAQSSIPRGRSADQLSSRAQSAGGL